tara:strand:+ start:1416 stop:2054 length:639 start_codon:yes stop_codon:yes gene_type:complete
MFQKLLTIFRKKKIKNYKNYFLKDNLKDEIEKGLSCVGKWSYGNPKIYRWDWKSKIKIGNFCSLGPDIKFYIGGNHRQDWITTSPLPASQFSKTFNKAQNIKNFSTSKGDINIGNDVWIGGNTIILSGVTIGNGATIGAGSVVTSDILPFSVCAGNPIKKIRNRFDDDLIKKIQESQWWNFDDHVINELSEYLCSNNFDDFFEALKKFNFTK